MIISPFTMEDMDYSHKFKAACEGCRKQKVKCDRGSPTCSVCTRRGIDCVYSAKAGGKSEMKRFYDKTGNNIRMFKCVKDESVKAPPKKVARCISPAIENGYVKQEIITRSSCLPELTYDSSPTSSSRGSSSPGADHRTTFPYIATMYPSPLITTIEFQKPHMESIVDRYDVTLMSNIKGRYGLGCSILEDNYVIKHNSNFLQDRKKAVSILGLDCNPVYNNIESDYGALSSALEVHLINLFFNQVNTFFPLIHRGKFFSSLRSPSTRPCNFLLNAIYFVACPFLPLSPMYFSGCHFKLAQHYHQEAMGYLEENISNPTLTSLQALLLLYNGECSLVEKFNKIQYKMIDDLNLQNKEFEELSAEDREEVTNLLWCCYLQDKVCNLTRCRSFALLQSKYSLRLPKVLELPRLTDPFPLPGAQLCQLAFIGSIKLAVIIEEVQTALNSCQSDNIKSIFAVVAFFKNKLDEISSSMASLFEKSNLNAHSSMSLVIFRLYFHMALIHLYLTASSLLDSSYHKELLQLKKLAIASACGVTFLIESLNVDFFRFGPLLKVNSMLLAYTVHRIAMKIPDERISYLGQFGKSRSIITNVRNVGYRLGLTLTDEKLESLMIEFVTPPKKDALRKDRCLLESICNNYV